MDIDKLLSETQDLKKMLNFKKSLQKESDEIKRNNQLAKNKHLKALESHSKLVKDIKVLESQYETLRAKNEAERLAKFDTINKRLAQIESMEIKLSNRKRDLDRQEKELLTKVVRFNKEKEAIDSSIDDERSDLKSELASIKRQKTSLLNKYNEYAEKEDCLQALKISIQEERDNFQDEKRVYASKLNDIKSQEGTLTIQKQELFNEQKQIKTLLQDLKKRKESLDAKDKQLLLRKEQLSCRQIELEALYKRIKMLATKHNLLKELDNG